MVGPRPAAEGEAARHGGKRQTDRRAAAGSEQRACGGERAAGINRRLSIGLFASGPAWAEWISGDATETGYSTRGPEGSGLRIGTLAIIPKSPRCCLPSSTACGPQGKGSASEKNGRSGNTTQRQPSQCVRTFLDSAIAVS